MPDFPFRLSPSPDPAGPTADYEGLVKLRLAHAPGRSYLIPELVLARLGRRWIYFIPSFFGPNWIDFHDERAVQCDLSLDVVRPGTNRGVRLALQIAPADLRRSYEGGGHLYGCTLHGPLQLGQYAGGRAKVDHEADPLLEMFHFTDVKGQVGIRGSGELWSTNWNLAGLQQLENVAYGYCTTLTRVRGRADLARIAMATDGRLAFRTTPRGLEPEEVFNVKVYRDSTEGRTHRLAFWAPAGGLAPPHLLFHAPMAAAAYYEIVGPEILRLAVRPGASIPVSRQGVMTIAPEIQRGFDYVIEGDASTPAGVSAPYREEETRSVAHLEPLKDDDPFTFWWREQNRNLSDRVIANPRRLVPGYEEP